MKRAKAKGSPEKATHLKDGGLFLAGLFDTDDGGLIQQRLRSFCSVGMGDRSGRNPHDQQTNSDGFHNGRMD